MEAYENFRKSPRKLKTMRECEIGEESRHVNNSKYCLNSRKNRKNLMRGRAFNQKDENINRSNGPPLYKKMKWTNIWTKMEGSLEDEIIYGDKT